MKWEYFLFKKKRKTAKMGNCFISELIVYKIQDICGTFFDFIIHLSSFTINFPNSPPTICRVMKTILWKANLYTGSQRWLYHLMLVFFVADVLNAEVRFLSTSKRVKFCFCRNMNERLII